MDFDEFVKLLNGAKEIAPEGKPIRIMIQSSSNFNVLGLIEDDGLEINIIRID